MKLPAEKVLPVGQRVLRCFVALTSATLLSCSTGGQAADLFQEAVDSPRCQILLGEKDLGGDEGSWNYFRQHLLPWDFSRIVNIIPVSPTAQSPFLTVEAWKTWFLGPPRGQRRQVRIEPTENGLLMTSIKASDRFRILDGACTIQTLQEVVSDDEIKVQTEKYRVIQAVVRRESTELGEALRASDGFGADFYSGDYKVRLLLKWDAFSKTWRYADERGLVIGGLDFAPISEEFQTTKGLPPSGD